MDSSKLFPEFEKFAEEVKLITMVKGALSAKLPRILGQGATRAIGLDLPPSPLERRIELVNVVFPKEISFPNSVKDEIYTVKQELEKEISILKSEEGMRKLCSQVIRSVNYPGGIKNNYFYADRFLLIPDKKRLRWSWSITPYYPIISNIPSELDYIVRSHEIAEKKIKDLLLEPEDFENMLELSWTIARHF